MKLEQASTSVRVVGDRIFDFIDGLTGSPPSFRESDGKCYIAKFAKRAFLWVHVYGDRAQGDRRNAIVLNSKWDERLVIAGTVEGNDFHGQRSISLAIHPDKPKEIDAAKRFIRIAREVHS